jgi:dTDP-glucose 4,6-dehydratase
MTILVTGGAGFIGSNLLHHLVNSLDEQIICIDNLTYASNKDYIPENVKLYVTDIADEHSCEFVFKKHKPRAIFHLAAESHVDNSIKDCSNFIITNINGTVNLLNLAVKYQVEKFIHISTDEVYGSIEEGYFTEKSNYDPKNPYSASKAASDHFVMAYHNTYGLPVIITNCSNNYGPRQHIEKMIAKSINNLIFGRKIPIYGDGKQVRDWLYVQDHCEALLEVLNRGKVGQKYNIGGECEVKNIDVIRMILDRFNMGENMIEYVKDRPGHDRRYSTDITKIRHEIKWAPRVTLEQGLEKTINWYESNKNQFT